MLFWIFVHFNITYIASILAMNASLAIIKVYICLSLYYINGEYESMGFIYIIYMDV